MSISNSSILNKINILVCPTCEKSIPIIEPVKDKGEVVLQIQCKCTDKIVHSKIDKYLEFIDLINNGQEAKQYKCCRDNHATRKADKYCALCHKWLCQDCLLGHKEILPDHILLDNEINLTCIKHKKEFIQYCVDCKQSLCSKCDSHKTHYITSLKDGTSNQLIKIDQIDTIMKSNLKYKDDFNQWIDAAIQTYNQWKTEVNQTYEHNRLINDQLKQLCQLIQRTALLIVDYPNHSINKTIEAIQVSDNCNLPIINSNLEQSYKLLTLHFGYSYVLTIMRHKITQQQVNQHTYKCLETHQLNKTIGICYLVRLNEGKCALVQYRMITIYSMTPFKCLNSFEINNNAKTCIQLHNDILLLCCDEQFELWSITKCLCMASFPNDSCYDTRSLCQLDDGRVISGHESGMIKIWKMTTFKCVNEFQTDSDVLSLTQLNDRKLVSGHLNGMIKLWSTITFKCLMKFNSDCKYVTSIIQLNDKRLASEHYDKGIIKLWSTTTFKCLKSVEADSVYSLIQSDNGLLMSFSFNSTTISIWDI